MSPSRPTDRQQQQKHNSLQAQERANAKRAEKHDAYVKGEQDAMKEDAARKIFGNTLTEKQMLDLPHRQFGPLNLTGPKAALWPKEGKMARKIRLQRERMERERKRTS